MKKIALLLLIAVFVFGGSIPSSGASPRAGQPCIKLGVSAKSLGKSLVCSKSGSKKIWKTQIVKPTRSTYNWISACQEDPFIEPEWSALQKMLLATGYCASPMAIVPSTLTQEAPKSEISGPSALSNLEACKLPNQRKNGSVTGFQTKKKTLPGPVTRFQVVPFLPSDVAPAKRTPLEDYGKYFKFLESVYRYWSDGESNISFNIPDHYYPVSAPIGPTNLGVHSQPTETGRSYLRQAALALDSDIDYSKVDMAIYVIPDEAPVNLLDIQPWAQVSIPENDDLRGLTMQPTAGGSNKSRSSYPLDVLHELMHGGIGLDDHYGDQTWAPGEGYGTGNWGLMSSIKSDLLTWEKWLLGFTLDSQIRCAKAGQTSSHWLAPSSVKTKLPKLLVIPVSKTKAIAVESIRNYGLNFKLPEISWGALIYTVDTSELRHGFGLQVFAPEDRKFMSERTPARFVGANDVLKQGDSLSILGHEITVIEAGKFGDVIQVKPLAG